MKKERPAWVQEASRGWTFNCPDSVVEFLYASSLSLDAGKEFKKDVCKYYRATGTSSSLETSKVGPLPGVPGLCTGPLRFIGINLILGACAKALSHKHCGCHVWFLPHQVPNSSDF